MYRRILFYSLMLICLQVLAGCGGVKVTLPSIKDGMSPEKNFAGKVHLMTVRDNSRIPHFESGFYGTNSGRSVEDDEYYLSRNNPFDAVQMSLLRCLIQTGALVTHGPTAPTDADLIVDATVDGISVVHDSRYSLYAGVVALALSKYTTGKRPVGTLVMQQTISAPAKGLNTTARSIHQELSHFHLTKSGGGETAFLKAQESYCGWLQEKLVFFWEKPQEAMKENEEELEKWRQKLRVSSR